MGPRHRCRGNETLLKGVADAMVSLQWGRGIDAAEMRRLMRSIDLLKALQWGRGIDAAEIAAPGHTHHGARCCFNGAAASMPRKFERETSGAHRRFSASMGPRHRCRGNVLMRLLALCPESRFNGAAASMPRKLRHADLFSELQTRFNGAAASMPRKCEAGRAGRPHPIGLQWGRGIDAAEICYGSGQQDARRPASMGPRHRCRGNIGDRKRQCHKELGFNGAAASMPRKFDTAPAAAARYFSFNGAAASMPRKCGQGESAGGDRPASMGPRHRCRGNLLME